MAVNWVDRVPTRANRVLVTPENGGTPYYATITRADEPSVVGTPVNAANLNAMQEASGLTGYKNVYVSTTGSDTSGTGSETAPYATITKAISTIPANLNGYMARIYLESGTYTENVTIQNFGNGIIALTGKPGASVTIVGLVSITNVQLMQVFEVSINIQSSYLSVVGSNLSVYTPFSTNGESYGVHASLLSRVVFLDTVTINNTTGNALAATIGSTLYVERLLGSGNTNLIACSRGSICAFGTNEASGKASYFSEKGGRILSAGQSSIPNY